MHWAYGKNVGGVRVNDGDGGQAKKSAKDVGTQGWIDRLDFGGMWHDKWFALVSDQTTMGKWTIFSGPLKAVGDLGLTVNCALAIVPGPKMAPVLPAAMTAVGITFAAPFHATYLDRIMPGM